MVTVHTSANLSENQSLCNCLQPFLITKGSRVLEKTANKAQLSKTVLSHLKEMNCSHLKGIGRLIEVLQIVIQWNPYYADPAILGGQ